MSATVYAPLRPQTFAVLSVKPLHDVTGFAHQFHLAVVLLECRDGNVIGMSPEPKVAYVPNPRRQGYTHPTPATPAQLIVARTLWMMAVLIAPRPFLVERGHFDGGDPDEIVACE